MKNFATILLSVFYIISCNKLNIGENPSIYTKSVELTGFNELIVNTNSTILLSQTANPKTLISGYEKQLNQTNFSIVDSTLTITGDYKNFTKNYNPIEIQLAIHQISNITCKSPCNLYSTDTLSGNKLLIKLQSKAQIVETDLNLRYDTLNFFANGSLAGRFTLSGTCLKSSFTLNGLNSLRAENLRCESITIINYAKGDHYVYATKQLNAVIHSGSNIYYRGSPTISVTNVKVNSVEPSGRLIKID